MDVTCERCSTAYEFDDALVSERGTTVKCTNCGFQFKVRRAAQASTPERWLVRTIDGREIEFRALRELQGAIVQTTISREDVLSRGGARPRRLGSIAELEPFFSKAGQPAAIQEMTRRNTAALGTRRSAAAAAASAASSTATPLPGVIVSPVGAPSLPSAPRSRMDSGGSFDEGPAIADASRPNGVVARPSSPTDAAARPSKATRDEAKPPAVDARASAPEPSQKSRAPDSSSPSLNPALSGPPSRGRAPYSSDESIVEPPRRLGAARWIVGFVVAGSLVLFAATVGRKYIPSSPPATPAPVNSGRDERVSVLLREGEESLLEGDIEGAKEHFDKASVFSEVDPRVAQNLAHLAVVRADFVWLRVRILPESDPDLGAARHELEQLVQRARKASDRAFELAPSEPDVLRTRIHGLRLDGDIDAARRLVPGITAASTQPDNALALAELDLAEAKPDWVTVIGRLRAALSGDQNLGRARAMLVYALARSGDLPAARAENERLATLPRPHPLLRQLRAFLAREVSAVPDASASVSAKAPDAKTPPSVAGRDREPANVGSKSVPDDYVAPNGAIDTSDLPGVKPTPGTTSRPAPPPGAPPGVDTSDLPGFK
jgi:predicted Zn finger-like uncharacterized protein